MWPSGAARAGAAALVLVSAAACGTAAASPAPPLPDWPVPTLYPKSAPPASPWGRPAVSDDFDGDRVDPAKWVVYDSPDAAVNPRTAAATTVTGGALKLTGGLYGGRDLSGGIASRLHLTHGRWEVRMRADRGVGYSAVALLWPKVFGAPEAAEINFAEMIDPSRRSTGLFVHHGPEGTQLQRSVDGDFTRWHVFALDWLPHRLTFWKDGRRVWDYRGPLTPERSRMGLALQNDQVCDRGPGFCRTRATPRWVSMYVDWARIYRAPH
ncbi:glycoside hydrolase family 16 protein [Actinomadura parmotrematis]|uniref:Glycoside hydrolase family 16 protein n=1 Tax=Actinomadura parmotrematis TaxID=2864039 RepID=A0ABS7FMD1_9ACTN|nr:glycoside hydrolase family 16 protein [Actinomadura parmotrematis]MBW8481534.1 glycoside hydrolase family 16 protein [Actinomadura parmotrematis]